MKFTYLLATAVLMLLSAAAMAQDGESPFEGSTHIYKVTPGASGNGYEWSISGGAGASGYTINSAISGTTGTGEISFSVTWNTASATDYILKFTETNPTTSCATVKSISITVGTNSFDVSTSDPNATCNAADGSTNFIGPNATTDVTFTVAMETGDTSFNPNWRFTFELSSVSGATFANVEVDGTAVTPSGSTYTSPDLTSASGVASVTVTMEVTGGAFAIQDAVLAIQSAIELSYNTPDGDSDDRTATQTINSIPNTTDITTD